MIQKVSHARNQEDNLLGEKKKTKHNPPLQNPKQTKKNLQKKQPGTVV